MDCGGGTPVYWETQGNTQLNISSVKAGSRSYVRIQISILSAVPNADLPKFPCTSAALIQLQTPADTVFPHFRG